jgi:hypothetical protein
MVVLPAASSPTCSNQQELPFGPSLENKSKHLKHKRWRGGTAHHQNPHLLLGEEAGKELRECEPHCKRLGAQPDHQGLSTCLCASRRCFVTTQAWGRGSVLTARLSHRATTEIGRQIALRRQIEHPILFSEAVIPQPTLCLDLQKEASRSG